MTKIDFHILPHTEENSRWLYCCRLIAKAVRQGHKVVLALESSEQCQLFSEYLWHFKEEAFFPHAIELSEDEAIQLVVSGKDYPNLHEYYQLCILMSSDIPIWFAQFERAVEIVYQQTEVLASCREHYRFFQQRGYEIKRFDLR